MRLDVAYSTDNNYVQHLGVSMLSLFENNKEFDEIYIHILDNNIDEHNKSNLIEIARKYNRSIKFYDINVLLNNLDTDYQIPATISITAYGRLFLSDIISDNISSILYLDCDSVIMGSFISLVQMPFDDKSIFGALDHVGNTSKKLIGLSENDDYINSGFLYINLYQWKKEAATKKMIDFIKEKKGVVHHHDQGVINACFKGKIGILHPRYNVMTSFYEFKNIEQLKTFYGIDTYYNQTDINEAKQNPVFLHLTPGFSKRPWIKGCRHPLKNMYLKYLNLTPWRESPLQKDKRKLKLKILDHLFWTFGAKFYKKITG